MEPRSDRIIADVLEQWPEATMVFVEHGMACPGCAMAPFGTVADAARHYDLDLAEFLRDLREAVEDNAS